MAYEKFALIFTLIDQIVFEIITNQFTPFPVAARLAHLQISFHYNFFSIDFKNIFAKKELSVYIE